MRTYRGFTIETRKTGATWAAKWTELTGGGTRRTFYQPSEDAAVTVAKERIDEYYRRLAQADYSPGGRH